MDLRFVVLGQLEVVDGGRPMPVGGPRPRALLAVLLVEAGRVVSRRRLIDELWGDDPPPTAVAALQVHVASLRKLVGAVLRTAGNGYLLDVAPGQVDAARFEDLLQRAGQAGDPAARSGLLRDALALWRGEAFANVPPTPTVTAAVARLVELHLGAIEARVEADLALGQHQELVPELRELVAANPCRERLAGQLMLALHRCGRSADALGVCARLRQALEESLGVDPAEELIALEKAIWRDDPTLAAREPVSLPSQPGRFIGRTDELRETAELLGRTHLLTLVGPGGCGKTRLALELARQAAPAHPGGVQFVDLAPLEPTASVASAVVTELRLARGRGEPELAALTAHLRDRRLLLVLDNCERVAESCAELTRRLLPACPGLRVLVTSRQPLGLPGEVVWQVPGLDVPATEAGAEAATGSDAVRLLADRAGSALPGWVLGADDWPLAAAICRRLDGLPLAIELVAARLASMSLAEVAANLHRRLSLLTSPGPVGLDRHRTIGAAIDWSHELLEPDERALFRRLSVFAGSFELAAAEEVGAEPGGDPPRSAGEVLPRLLRLVDKSMVVAARSGGRTRYRLLETIREYAAERLEEAGEGAAARTRHAAWCARLAASASGYGGADHELVVARLGAELGSLRAALGWCLGDGRAPEQALSIIAPLWWYWWLAGLGDEGRAWLLRCLAAVDPAPSPVRALALRAAAALARQIGEHAEARSLGEECLATNRALGDEVGIAAALNSLSITLDAVGDYEAAVGFALESLERFRAAGDRRGQAIALNSVGRLLACLERLEEGEEAIRSGLQAFREVGDRRGEAAALNNLALLARRAGDTERARRSSLESLAVYRALQLPEGELDALETLAAVDAAVGRLASALRIAAVAERERRRLGAAVLTTDEQATRDATLAAVAAGLDDGQRAAVLADVRLVQLEDLVAGLLSGGGAPAGGGAGRRLEDRSSLAL